MHIFRFSLKRLSIWILLLIQLLVITSYFYFQPKLNETDMKVKSVTFFKTTNKQIDSMKITYHRDKDMFVLGNIPTRYNFTDFNTSLCYTNGTDLKSMLRSNDINWKCTCMPGWHGNDCGQPEVIWRAFLAYRKPISSITPRKYQRRLIFVFEVTEYTQTLADIRVNELNHVVDLFVLYEVNSKFLVSKLNNDFLQQYHFKILYLNITGINYLWPSIKNSVPNMNRDDILLMSGNSEIPNKAGILFLKFYNGWPEPINFRLKYSVYGFYWIHPTKTVLNGGASTIEYVEQILNGDLKYLNSNKSLSNLSSKNFIIGDLNHYGGWFCEFCNDPTVIINHLINLTSSSLVNWENVNKIDNMYLESLIENGVYLDGKTTLNRAHRYHENYFAPTYVKENSWKYDFLLTNMYSKMDYYD